MQVNRPGVVDGVILCTHITHPKDSTEAEYPEIFERYGCEGLGKTERKVKVYVPIVDGGVTLAQAVCLKLGNAEPVDYPLRKCSERRLTACSLLLQAHW
jgi:hypothetical protein